MAFAPDLEERKLGEGSRSPWVCSALRGTCFLVALFIPEPNGLSFPETGP